MSERARASSDRLDVAPGRRRSHARCAELNGRIAAAHVVPPGL
ncbi:MAG TPA: hypothetical protein VE646_10840 [Actinomycetota bacterium]|jgi:hypothetical protein|nr:hypothetical protein [Actinomycetota bacterium]